MKYLPHHKIDFSKWDDTVKNSINPKMMYFSWYLNSVCPKWSALVNDDYSVIFPLPEKKYYMLTCLVQPFMIQRFELIYLNKNFNINSAFNECIEYIHHHYLIADFNVGLDECIAEVKHFYKTENYNVILPFDKQYEEIQSHYSTNTKRNIKKAALNNAECMKVDDSDRIIDLFENDRGISVGWKAGQTKDLKSLLKEIENYAVNEKYGVFYENKMVCGAIFICYDKRWTFAFSGNSQVGKTIGAMPFLVDYFISQKCNKSFYLDFEGSNDEGLRRFYKSFGACEQTYLRLQSKILKIIRRNG